MIDLTAELGSKDLHLLKEKCDYENIDFIPSQPQKVWIDTFAGYRMRVTHLICKDEDLLAFIDANLEYIKPRYNHSIYTSYKRICAKLVALAERIKNGNLKKETQLA